MSEQFDLKTHYRDPKSGKVVRVSPYRLVVSKRNGDVVKVFERDGIKRYENNEIVSEAPVHAEATLDAVVSKIASEPVVTKGTQKTG